MADLHIPIKGEYFDQIRNGTKTEEYRLRNDYWERRLRGRVFERVILTRGYPKGGGVEDETRLTLPWRGYREKTITHPHFGDEPVPVYAIAVPRLQGVQNG
jgi:hypothetical protein